MLRKSFYFTLVVIAQIECLTAGVFASTHEFFKGKTVRIAVGVSAGGAFELTGASSAATWESTFRGIR